jgi:hypothetical protein
MPELISTSHRRLRISSVALLLVSSVLALAASPAFAGTFEGYPSEVAFVTPQGTLGVYETPEYTGGAGYVWGTNLGAVRSGTSPSVAGERVGSCCLAFEVAFQNPNGDLWISALGTPGYSEGLGMAPGTSPSIAHWYDEKNVPHHKYAFAFQANSGSLWYNHTNQAQGMRAGTSPSLLPDGNIAFQANTGHLLILNAKTGSGVDTGLGMAAGSSPSITELGGGAYEVAFVANTGRLWTYCSCSGGHETGMGVETGTSPSIVDIGLPGWVVAFQGSGTHDLWTYTSAGVGTDRGVGVYSGSSPSIALRSGASWEVAFQTKTHELATYSTITGPVGTGIKMLTASSPGIAN